MGEWRIFGWSRNKKESDQATGAQQQGVQNEIASLRVLVEQPVRVEDLAAPDGIITSNSILKTIYDPLHLPNYETAKLIIDGIFAKPSDGHIGSTDCEEALNNRRIFELKKLEDEYLLMQNDLKKMGKPKQTARGYLQVLRAKQSLTTFFFNKYWQMIDNERSRLNGDLKPIETPRDRLKDMIKPFRPILAEKKKERELLLREVFVLEEANWSVLDAVKKVAKTFSTIKSAMPYIASGIGCLSVWPPEFVQKYAVKWVSQFAIVDSFLRANYPIIRGIAIMVGLTGIASLALKVRNKYTECQQAKADRRKKMEEIIRLSRTMDLLQKKMDEIQMIIDTLSQERKQLIDNRTKLLKKPIDDMLEQYRIDMEEADYF